MDKRLAELCLECKERKVWKVVMNMVVVLLLLLLDVDMM